MADVRAGIYSFLAVLLQKIRPKVKPRLKGSGPATTWFSNFQASEIAERRSPLYVRKAKNLPAGVVMYEDRVGG